MGAASLGRKERRGPYLLFTHLKLPGPSASVTRPRLRHRPGGAGGGQGECSAAWPSLPSTWPGAPPCCGLHTTCWQPLRLHGGWQPPELSAPPPPYSPTPGAAVTTVENISAQGFALGASPHLAHREEDALEGLLVTITIMPQDKGLYTLLTLTTALSFSAQTPTVCDEADVWGPDAG